MAVESIKRSLMKAYINTTPSSTATYALLNPGIEDLTIDYNPQTTTEQYVDDDTATVEITGYEPTISIDKSMYSDDAVDAFISTIRKARAVGSAAKTDIVIVDAYETELSTGVYPAQQQSVSVSVTSYGGAAGELLEQAFDLGFKGDAVDGTFDINSKTFTETPTSI